MEKNWWCITFVLLQLQGVGYSSGILKEGACNPASSWKIIQSADLMIKKLIFILVLFGLVAPVNSFAVPGFLKQRMGTMEGQVFLDGKTLDKPLLAFFSESDGLPPIPGGLVP